MLRQRVITAILLLSILLPALFASDPLYFVVCTVALMVAAAWEWGRLSGQENTISLLGAAGFGLVCMGLWQWPVDPAQLVDAWLIASLAWSLLSVFALYAGAARWLMVPPKLRYVGGLVLLFVSWLALVQSKQLGINFLLSVMALVWVSDICAYFVGRAVGGRWIARKLAVTISPGKTWEGVVGALLGVALMALVWRYADSQTPGASLSIFSILAEQWGAMAVVLLGLLVVAGVVGDLLESLFKRAAGVKDSSGLLPGHGGVLDRVDALLPVVPMALWLASR